MNNLSNDELRFLRKQLSMAQAHMESRLDRAEGQDRDRLVRDMRVCETLYPKVQHELSARLIGDDDE